MDANYDKILQYVQQNFPSDLRSVNHFENHNSPIKPCYNYRFSHDEWKGLVPDISHDEWKSLVPDISPGHRILLSKFVQDILK